MVPKSFLKKNNLIDKNGSLNQEGWKLFSALLNFVKPYPNLTPGQIPSPYHIFDKYLSKIVPAAQELILVSSKGIYLTYRKDKWWDGWHTPGGHIRPRETITETCQRIADTEVPGIKIKSAKILGIFSCSNSPRFHNIVLMTKAEFEGEPSNGKWFLKFPSNFLKDQRQYISLILPYLKKSIN